MSSGCIRLLNRDVIDLYRGVPIGSRTVILPSDGVTLSTDAPRVSSDINIKPHRRWGWEGLTRVWGLELGTQA